MKVSVSILVLLCLSTLIACKSRPPEIGEAILTPIQEKPNNSNDKDTFKKDESGGLATEEIVDSNPGYSGNLTPVFFDYDRAEIRSDQIEVLQTNAQYLHNVSAQRIQIQGHCDERGTEEYNLALGDRRARAVKEYLSSLGISDERLVTISFGEAMPFETEHQEAAWSKNRRAHFQEHHRP